MRLATTAFSFTNEWLTRRHSLEQMLRRAAELDLGPGIELVGFQSWRRYPNLTAEDVLAFRRLVDELELEPAALGAYVDLARRADRPMSTAEAVAFLEPQIDAAEALGFPLLRLHGGIPAAVLEQLAPRAERRHVTLATEVQGGQMPDDPGVQALLECRERLGSRTVALVLDASIAMKAVPTRFVEAVRALGMAAEDLDALLAQWAQGARTHELFGALQEIDAPPAALNEARAGFVRFGRQEPQDWLPLVPYVAYVHAKFWELDDDGDEPTTRNAELFEVLRAGGYDGFVASEWGGNAWAEADEVDAFELVRRHHELCRDLISNPAMQVPA
jgi:sugar phosphate isomerase/epimerase